MKFVIPYKLNRILKILVEKNAREFTLFGKTRIVGEEVQLLDIRVPNQRSSVADTEVSSENLVEFMEKLLEDGENPKDWNMWIHSHNTMGAFWSGTDTAQMKSFNCGPDFFFHMVMSTTGAKGAMTMYKPYDLENIDIPVYVRTLTAEEHPEIFTLQEQIEALTKRRDELTAAIAPEVDTLLKEIEDKNTVYYNAPAQTKYDWETPGHYGDDSYDDLPPGAGEEVEDKIEYLSAKQYRKALKKTYKHPSKCICNICLNIMNYESRFNEQISKPIQSGR